MSSIDTIEFSSNHNNKLFCDVFTTIRKRSPKYELGNEYDLYIGKHHIGRGRIKHMSERHLTGHVNEIMALLDCGKPKQYLHTLLQNMYGKHIVQEVMYYLTIEVISRNPNGQIWMLKNYCDRHNILTQLTPEQAELFQ